MSNDQELTTRSADTAKPWGMELNTFCMLMHLSQLAGYVVVGAGLVLPIIMWATNKDDHPEVRLHGLIIFNWMLSALIYTMVAVILVFVLIGIPVLIAIGICGVIFAVIGAVKADSNIYWEYPLSIDFFGARQTLEMHRQ